MSRFLSEFCSRWLRDPVTRNCKKEKRAMARRARKRVGNRSAEGCKPRGSGFAGIRRAGNLFVQFFRDQRDQRAVCPPLIRGTFIKNPWSASLRPVFSSRPGIFGPRPFLIVPVIPEFMVRWSRRVSPWILRKFQRPAEPARRPRSSPSRGKLGPLTRA